MQISALTTVAALAALAATSVSATRINIYITQHIVPVVMTTLITDDGDGHSYGYFLDGCKKKLDFVKEICIDDSKGRAHIVWTNQPGRKLCLLKTKRNSFQCGCNGNQCVTCTDIDFTETPCTW
ncbi:hypothetical protein MN608_10991 [Microdochium nivale]|nr:hypothetical protein MN608_10991 [Microdochium nivale]